MNLRAILKSSFSRFQSTTFKTNILQSDLFERRKQSAITDMHNAFSRLELMEIKLSCTVLCVTTPQKFKLNGSNKLIFERETSCAQIFKKETPNFTSSNKSSQIKKCENFSGNNNNNKKLLEEERKSKHEIF